MEFRMRSLSVPILHRTPSLFVLFNSSSSISHPLILFV